MAAVFSAPAPGEACIDITVGASTANSYIGADDLVNYLRCRVNAADKLLKPLYDAVAASVAVAESLLLRSVLYIDNYAPRFRGQRKTETQSLAWPRDDVYIGFDKINPDTIPDEIKVAQVYFCGYLQAQSDPFAELPEGVSTSETDGPEVIDGTVTRAGTVSQESYLSGLYSISYKPAETDTRHYTRNITTSTQNKRVLGYNDRSIEHYMHGAVDIMRPLLTYGFGARRA